ncbi:transcription factor Zn C2H2 protein [Rutstroemia sp. NJR-2017a BBW]|nr:transcription factor Zn C2H2 protein [Rutstroemia sp. NJR-2017a BBW]
MPPKRKGKEKAKKCKRQNRKRKEKKEEKGQEQSQVAGPAPHDSPGPSTSYDTGAITALTSNISNLSINQTGPTPLSADPSASSSHTVSEESLDPPPNPPPSPAGDGSTAGPARARYPYTDDEIRAARTAVADFNAYFGNRYSLENWQRLCRDVRIDRTLRSTTECSEALERVYVNIFSLVAAIKKGKAVPTFESNEELMEWTVNNNKFFPSNEAHQAGGPLRALLRNFGRRCWKSDKGGQGEDGAS